MREDAMREEEEEEEEERNMQAVTQRCSDGE
jgi:hypothetical protein